MVSHLKATCNQNSVQQRTMGILCVSDAAKVEADHLKLTKCYISGSQQTGFAFYNNSNVTIENVELSNVKFNAISSQNADGYMVSEFIDVPNLSFSTFKVVNITSTSGIGIVDDGFDAIQVKFDLPVPSQFHLRNFSLLNAKMSGKILSLLSNRRKIMGFGSLQILLLRK